MFFERGFVFTRETVREWEAKLAPRVAPLRDGSALNVVSSRTY